MEGKEEVVKKVGSDNLAKLDTTLEKLKKRVPSMEEIQRKAVYQMKQARNDLALQKIGRAWVLVGAAIGGLSTGIMWVPTDYDKDLVQSKERKQ